VRGIAEKSIWELDHDFLDIYVQFMLTIGSNVYMQLSNNTIWKRDSSANYTQIKSGLNMAGLSICSLGNDAGRLIIDSQHSGYDRLYTLDDDGTLTIDNDKYGSAGYAGLIHNGSYLFWVRDIGASNGSVRKGAWQDNAVSAYNTANCWIDQMFAGAIPGINCYFSGSGDYLTTNSWAFRTCPDTHNFGVFNSKLYGCSTTIIKELSTYAGGWSTIACPVTGSPYYTAVRGCYGYGPYLYVSGERSLLELHRIYRWDGTTWELDHELSYDDAYSRGGPHRFVMVGGTLLNCSFNRVMRKQIA
jgi:hypothetical protein